MNFSRERKKLYLEETEKMNKLLAKENEILKQKNAELLSRISQLESEVAKFKSWKSGIDVTVYAFVYLFCPRQYKENKFHWWSLTLDSISWVFGSSPIDDSRKH